MTRFQLTCSRLVAAIATLALCAAPAAVAAEPTQRVNELVETARAEAWGADELFDYLELDDDSRCRDYTNRAHLRERRARWSEAILLLEKIDSDALDAWMLGTGSPPDIAIAETKRQLRCMFADLIDAARKSSYEIRLFADFSSQFGGHFRDAGELAEAIDRNPRWLDRATNALTRSTTRNLLSQSYIWHRKFIFSGRNFNRITEEAAQACGLGAGYTWRPENQRHQRCWRNELSPSEREREILTASAAPGLSRHHWGTDVDILGLNPVFFRSGGVLHGDWRWLDDHGLDYGFFQTYGDAHDGRRAHMEERWHWSYYPIAQALWEFARHNQERFEEALFAQWERLERRWGGGPYFDHMREHWRDYLFHIDVPNVDARHAPGSESDRRFTPLP